jgi:hypothetical protein
LLSLEKILKKHLNELAHKGLRKLLLCGSLVSPSICGIKNSKKTAILLISKGVNKNNQTKLNAGNVKREIRRYK